MYERRNSRYNITVGPAQDITPDRFDAILNVADTPFWLEKAHIINPKCRYYWYPINEESRWGHGPFFWSKRILDIEYARGSSIGIHCAAGAHRSPMIAYAWITHQNKKHPMGVDQIFTNGGADDWSITHDNPKVFTIHDRWNIDVQKCHIPNDIMEMYDVMDNFPSYSLMGCVRMLYK